MTSFHANALRMSLLAALLLAVSTPVSAADEKAEEGKPAPAVKLQVTQPEKLGAAKDAKEFDLASLKGKKNVVLFFYPKAMTPGCTVESCGFTKITDEFAKVDTVVIGISTDNLENQQKFTEKEKLTTPLFADPDKKVTKAFGALAANGNVASRYTYVIDKKGVVRKIYNKVDVNKHPEEVLMYVKENLKD